MFSVNNEEDLTLLRYVLETEEELKALRDDNLMLQTSLNVAQAHSQMQDGIIQHLRRERFVHQERRVHAEFRLKLALENLRMMREEQAVGSIGTGTCSSGSESSSQTGGDQLPTPSSSVAMELQKMVKRLAEVDDTVEDNMENRNAAATNVVASSVSLACDIPATVESLEEDLLQMNFAGEKGKTIHPPVE